MAQVEEGGGIRNILETSQGAGVRAVRPLQDVPDDNEYTTVSDVTYAGVIRSGAGGGIRV